jgi:hypothetical protein
MRWRTCWLCVLSLVALTGCPEDFGIDGRMDQAIRKDMRERLEQQCTDEELRLYCGRGKPEETCREKCG